MKQTQQPSVFDEILLQMKGDDSAIEEEIRLSEYKPKTWEETVNELEIDETALPE